MNYKKIKSRSETKINNSKSTYCRKYWNLLTINLKYDKLSIVLEGCPSG